MTRDAYRDDHAAALARVDALETELAQVARERDQLASQTTAPSDIGALYREQARAKAREEEKALQAEARAAAKQQTKLSRKIASRTARIVETLRPGVHRVTIRRLRLGAALGTQSFAAWMTFFCTAFFMIFPFGILLASIGVAAAVISSAVISAVVILGFVAVVRLIHRDWHLDFTSDGYFALLRGRRSKFLGPTRSLSLGISKLDPSKLHTLAVHGADVWIDHLTPADVSHLRAALAGRAKIE